MYKPALTTAPATTPITLAEVKAQLEITGSESDTVLTALIAAAVSQLDGWTGTLGRCLVQQSWRQDYDCFARCLRLPLGPVISVTNVKYYDAAGVEQTVASDQYQLLADGEGWFVKFNAQYSFPALRAERPAVSVTYAAGYGQVDAASTVPAAIKQAMHLMVRQWFQNPGSIRSEEVDGVGKIVYQGLGDTVAQPAIDALLAPYRVQRL